MCYTGKCPYEIGCGENVGECKLHRNDIPFDAPCVTEGLSEDELKKIKYLQAKKGRFRILFLNN
jgi:hypothetical protein